MVLGLTVFDEQNKLIHLGNALLKMELFSLYWDAITNRKNKNNKNIYYL